jgi:hypothetical protein
VSLIPLPGGDISLVLGHGGAVPTPFIQTIPLLECSIAGIGYHAADLSCRDLCPLTGLVLVREPVNPHDEDAIAIHRAGRRIGYIPRRHNAVLARLLDAGKCLTARVDRVVSHEAAAWPDVRIVVELEG